MTSVGTFEAKAHLSALLERVSRGERIAITRHGETVALLVPPTPPPALTRAEVVEELRRFRKGRKVSRRTIRRWIEEGRK